MLKRLFRSRKFLTLLLDTAASLLVFFITKYAAPSFADDILYILAMIQPIVLVVIVMWGVEDAALKRAGFLPSVESSNED